MKRFECLACGYIYDPAIGDPDGGIEPGTLFEDLPDDWVCPECGVGTDMFVPLDADGPESAVDADSVEVALDGDGLEGFEDIESLESLEAIEAAEPVAPELGGTGLIGEMLKYECLACGYIYDPALGDPDGGIPPGTPFHDIADDWVCPECGVGKEMFEVVDLG